MQITTHMKEKTLKDLLKANAKTIAQRLLELPKSEAAIDHEEIDRILAQIDFSNVAIDTEGSSEANSQQIRNTFREGHLKKLLTTGERQLYKFRDVSTYNSACDTPLFDSKFHVFIL